MVRRCSSPLLELSAAKPRVIFRLCTHRFAVFVVTMANRTRYRWLDLCDNPPSTMVCGARLAPIKAIWWNVRTGPKALCEYLIQIVRASIENSELPVAQNQTRAPQKVMSALPPREDMCGALADVCFGPKADLMQRRKKDRYSITSSARARNDCGTVRPSAFAVCMLTTSSYFIGC